MWQEESRVTVVRSLKNETTSVEQTPPPPPPSGELTLIINYKPHITTAAPLSRSRKKRTSLHQKLNIIV